MLTFKEVKIIELNRNEIEEKEKILLRLILTAALKKWEREKSSSLPKSIEVDSGEES